MTEVTVTDRSGKTISMLEIDGFRTSFFGHTTEYEKDVYENLPNFQFRDDDVFLASYPKAGCTWTFEILSMLLTGHLEGHPYNKMEAMLESKAAGALEDLPPPRLLNSHLPFDKLPPDLVKKKIKIIYVIRNYKDIAVSLYNFMRALKHYNYDGTWEDWLELHLDEKLPFSDYFSYAHRWEEVIENSSLPVHVLYYEDLKLNTLKEIRRLATFLGVYGEESFLKEISDNCQFTVMKKKYTSEALDSVKFKTGTSFYRKGKSAHLSVVFTKLSLILVRTW